LLTNAKNYVGLSQTTNFLSKIAVSEPDNNNIES